MNKRIFVILLTAILLVVSTFPVAAGAKHIPIQGTCYIVDGAQGAGYRIWENPTGISHWRNQIWYIHCDYNDPRLSGNYVASDNWDMFQNGRFLARSFGSAYSADENWNKTDLWETTTEAYTDWDWLIIAHVSYKGRGIYQGLLAHTTWTSAEYPYPVVGELIDPGQ